MLKLVKRGIEIRSRRDSSWRLTYRPLLKVRGGEYYTLKATLECSFTHKEFRFGDETSPHVVVRAIALGREFEPVRVRYERWEFGDPGEPFLCTDLGTWSCGSIALSGSRKTATYTFFRVPKGAEYLGVSIVGGGEGLVRITELKLEQGKPEQVAVEQLPTPFSHVPRALQYRRLRLGEYAAKLLRIGDLNGDGRPEFVFAQSERIGPGDVYKHVTCLTAIDLEGNVLWQLGTPHKGNYDVTSDLPVGVCDLDANGRDEVVCCMNFKLMILDGATGEVIRSRPTPKSRAGGGFCEGPETLFEHVLGDCIAFCDLRGLGRPRDFIVKDRYNNAWAFTDGLDLLWSYSGKLIHYPLVYDFDGDSRDEVFLGDALVDDNGRVLWEVELYDHCDSAVVYRQGDRLLLAVANQNGGFYFLDAYSGEVLREHHLGHAQVLSLARFDPRVDEPLICAQTYWGGLNQFLFNLSGELIYASFERVYGWVPVNWTGDGGELLASSHGLYDCYGNMLVELPNPPTGDAKVYVWDVCGDPRDEVIVWDREFLVIYTQANTVKGRVYRPARKLYNQTFYGNFISLPGWTTVDCSGANTL